MWRSRERRNLHVFCRRVPEERPRGERLWGLDRLRRSQASSVARGGLGWLWRGRRVLGERRGQAVRLRNSTTWLPSGDAQGSPRPPWRGFAGRRCPRPRWRRTQGLGGAQASEPWGLSGRGCCAARAGGYPMRASTAAEGRSGSARMRARPPTRPSDARQNGQRPQREAGPGARESGRAFVCAGLERRRGGATLVA